MPEIFAAEEIDTLPQPKFRSHPEVRTDVLVIGAGPTGLACAIEALKSGFVSLCSTRDAW
jgi:NADPH-dependent 2,4-dienoyl-CoA reductase/sulfur reductase-like enzyme